MCVLYVVYLLIYRLLRFPLMVCISRFHLVVSSADYATALDNAAYSWRLSSGKDQRMDSIPRGHRGDIDWL